MAYVANYEYDIFISYAHDDNTLGWIDAFHDLLSKTLKTMFGKNQPIQIWRDQQMNGNQIFDKTICDIIENAALFISLLSNNYLSSDYCRKELDWFISHSQSKGHSLYIGQYYHRVIHGLLIRIPPEKWPSALQGRTGFHFYDEQSCGGDGLLQLEINSPAFNSVFKKFIDAIYQSLKIMKQARKELPSPTPNNNKTTKIFFANTSDSLESHVKRSQAALAQNNIAMFDPIPPPYEVSEHERKARQCIKESCLCVHLLGEFPGKIIESDPDELTYPQKQLILSNEAKKPQLIWMPQNIEDKEIDNTAYHNLLTNLKNDTRVIRTQPSEITEQIIQRLNQMTEQSSEKLPRTKPKILVDTHVDDFIQAAELNNFLVQKQFQSLINPFDNQQNRMKQYESRLKDIQILIIFYGRVNQNWVVERLTEATKLMLTEKSSIHTRIIFVAPPKKETALLKKRLDYLLKGIQFLDNSDSEEILPDNISQIIAATQKGGES